MLLEMAIGDSYGSAFEFADKRFVDKYNDVQGYVIRKGRTPGNYTDDTQMAIAVAEAILADDVFDQGALAQRFVNCYKRDPREGYARGFRSLLDKVKDGKEFLSLIRPASDRSGSAMRSPPLGFLDSPRMVRKAALVQSRITHDTPEGINSSMASALMSHYFLYNKGSLAELGSWLESEVPGNWNAPWDGKVGSKGVQCVRAAVTALVRNKTLSGVLHDCIAFGGDVDTVAAIAMAAASSSKEMERNIPIKFFENLENSDYGKDYLEDLDRNLIEIISP